MRDLTNSLKLRVRGMLSSRSSDPPLPKRASSWQSVDFQEPKDIPGRQGRLHWGLAIFHPTQIDASLATAGWIVQSRAEMNLDAGLGVAVRDFSTASGPVDYALFVGCGLCGVIEAKPAGTTLSGSAEQAARDIADVPGHLVRREGR